MATQNRGNPAADSQVRKQIEQAHITECVKEKLNNPFSGGEKMGFRL